MTMEVNAPFTVSSSQRVALTLAHLDIQVFKRHSVSPQQLHRVPGHEADSKETLHLIRAGPLSHLESQREETWGDIQAGSI